MALFRSKTICLQLGIIAASTWLLFDAEAYKFLCQDGPKLMIANAVLTIFARRF